jgi:hypothetical protein
MPSVVCGKGNVRRELSRNEQKISADFYSGSLKDNLIALLNDGDFQYCLFTEVGVQIERASYSRTSKKAHTRYIDLSKAFPELMAGMQLEASYYANSYYNSRDE